jgi:hypothetical protein
LSVRGIDDLKRIAGQFKVVSEAREQIQKALKKGIDAYAPVGGIAIDGMWYGYKPTAESVDWRATEIKIREEAARAQHELIDKGSYLPEAEKRRLEKASKVDSLDAFLAQFGVKPGTFKTMDSAKAKALLKTDNQSLLEALKGVIVTDMGTRFGPHKN